MNMRLKRAAIGPSVLVMLCAGLVGTAFARSLDPANSTPLQASGYSAPATGDLAVRLMATATIKSMKTFPPAVAIQVAGENLTTVFTQLGEVTTCDTTRESAKWPEEVPQFYREYASGLNRAFAGQGRDGMAARRSVAKILECREYPDVARLYR